MPFSFPKYLHNEVINSYTSGIIPTKIAEQLNVSQRTVYLWLKKANLSHPEKWGSSSHITLEYNEDLGFVIGSLLGDGTFYSKPSKYTYQMRLRVKDYDFAKTYAKSMSHLTGKTVHIGKCKDYDGLYIVETWRKTLFNWIISHPLNKLRDIMLRNKEMAKGFIRGVFDAEGSVIFDKYNKCLIIIVTNTVKELLCLCKDLIEYHFKILVGKIFPRFDKGNGYFPNGKKRSACLSYVLKISSRKKIISYAQTVGFSIKRKQDKCFMTW